MSITKSPNIVVTGANGYLGGWVLHLLEKFKINYWACNSIGKVIRSGCQITDKPSLESMDYQQALRWADSVIHLAWYSSAGNREEETHDECFQATAQMGRYIGSYSSQKNVSVVFASTVSVYGEVEAGEVFYEDSPVNPNCYYTHNKVLAERSLIKDIGESRVCILRYGSMMGRGAPDGGRTKTELVVNAFAVDGFTNGMIEVWNPDSWKPVVHVQNAAEVAVHAAVQKWSGIYNVVSFCLTARTIALLARQVTQAEIKIVEDRSGSRSCRASGEQVNALMSKWVGGYPWVNPYQAVQEFKDYSPTPEDRNTPWSIRHSLSYSTPALSSIT